MAELARPKQIGSPPSLTARGRAWGWSGALLLLTGALTSSAHVAALGVAAIAGLCVAYLWFFPTAILLWRRYLEMSWALDRTGAFASENGFIVGRPFRLLVTLRSRGPLALGRARVRLFTSSGLQPPRPLSVELGAEKAVTHAAELVALEAGTWFVHGAAVAITSPLGLAAVEAYFPSLLSVKIFPRPRLRSPSVAARPTAGAPQERLGLHAIRQRGLGGDLRELRELAPGDPFKQIAWKASARTGKLMVRDLDRETMVTHFVLLDEGASMRAGRVGETKLDHAIELAAAYARGALEAGDRVGLLTFDGRIVGEVKPNDGPLHRLRLLESLMQTMNRVDEDLTELTDSELVALVARHLRHQEAVDAQVARAPAIDDPAWAHLATAPSGELYDLRILLAAARAVLGEPLWQRAQKRVSASSPESAQLRLYASERGLELPYRKTPLAGTRAAGFAQALERAASGRGMQRIFVISDLEGLDGEVDLVVRAVRLARRRGHRLRCAAPSGFRSTENPADALEETLGWDADRRQRHAVRRLAALGVPVVAVGPGARHG